MPTKGQMNAKCDFWNRRRGSLSDLPAPLLYLHREGAKILAYWLIYE